jgi:hypothetical protein
MISKKEREFLVTIGDKEYIVDKTKTGVNRSRVYTLDDGTKLTVEMLANKLKCRNSCARARLNASSDPKRVYKEVQKVEGRTRKTNDIAHLMDSRSWYKDPLTKLMLK